MQLSKIEEKTYETLKRGNLLIFKPKDISLLLKISKTKAYNLIKALKKKNAIESIQSGIYALHGTSEFVIATSLNWPSYISFWTALNYHNLTEQMPKTIFLASTKYKKQRKNFKFILVSKKRFFGYVMINSIVIAEKEKSLIDSLLFPKYAGGIKEIEKAFSNAIASLDIKKLIAYAIKIKSKAVVRRLGYLLEKNKIKGYFLKQLLKNEGKGYELLDPTLKRKNNFNKTWLLDINT